MWSRTSRVVAGTNGSRFSENQYLNDCIASLQYQAILPDQSRESITSMQVVKLRKLWLLQIVVKSDKAFIIIAIIIDRYFVSEH